VVGWILFEALLGGILQIVSEIAEIRYGLETAPGAQSESSPTAMFRERSLRIASWRLAQLRGNRCGFMVQFRFLGTAHWSAERWKGYEPPETGGKKWVRGWEVTCEEWPGLHTPPVHIPVTSTVRLRLTDAAKQ
jgi:hypothetical protein